MRTEITPEQVANRLRIAQTNRQLKANRAYRKQIETLLRENGCDAVTFRKDGAICAKRSYFYHHGYYSSNHAAKFNGILTNAGIQFESLADTDEFRNWPKTSYLVWIFKPIYPTVS